MAKKLLVIKEVRDGKGGRLGIKQAGRQGLNNLPCKCGGIRRRKDDGSLHCGRCGTSASETPL